MPLRSLAAQYGLSTSAPFRHTRHLARRLAQARHHADQAHLTSSLEKLDTLEVRLDRLFRTAEDFRLPHIALGWLRESLPSSPLRKNSASTGKVSLDDGVPLPARPPNDFSRK